MIMVCSDLLQLLQKAGRTSIYDELHFKKSILFHSDFLLHMAFFCFDTFVGEYKEYVHNCRAKKSVELPLLGVA